jgi:hypothetical protein
VILVVVAAVWASSQRSHDAGPADTTSPSDVTAIGTASAFVHALSSFDVRRAGRLLAPGATFTGSVNTKGWVPTIRFFRDTGGQITPDPCYVLSSTPANTIVDCPYSYQLMRSGELGLGPYTGSTFEITTEHGRVTEVNVDHETDSNDFGSQMWLPFAAWIDTFHHRDGATMYPGWPQQHHWPVTKEAIRLWSERTRQFVRYAQHMCSTPRGHHTAVCAGQPQRG